MIGIAPQHPGEHIEDENGNNLSYHDTVHKLIEREAIDSSERNVLVSHQFYLPAGIASDSIERMDSARQKQDIL